MKSKLLKLANVKSEQEFYKKYPTEDAFLKAFPKMKSELKQFANGGPGDGDGDPKRKTKYPVLDVTKIKPNSTADSLITWAQLPIAQAAIANRMAKGELDYMPEKQLKDSLNTIYKSFGVNPNLLNNEPKSVDLSLSYYKNEKGEDKTFTPREAYVPKSFVIKNHQNIQTRTRAAQSAKGKKVNANYAVFDINDVDNWNQFNEKTGKKEKVILPGRDSTKIMVSLKNKNDDKTKPLMLTTRNDAAEQNTFKNANYSGWNTVKNYYNDPSFNQKINVASPTLENPDNIVTRTFTPNFIMEQKAYGGLQEYADGGKIWKDIGAGAYGIGEGILDTATFGLTDQLTDKGYTALQKAGGTTNEEELKQQNAIRGGGNIAGAAGTAIFTGGATTGAAIGQGAKGANEIVQNTNIVPDEYKQTAGSIINLAGMAGSMAAGSPSSLSNPAATQFMNSNFTQGVQQMNKYKPFMNAVGFRNGGIQQYVDGGMGPNAEVEKQENTVAPDGTFTQYNGPSHEDGGIETTLDQGEMIFSDKLKPIGSKKTYAQLNKSFNTQKEDELLNDPKTNAVQKLTAAMMRRAKLTQSIALFQNQEQQKEAKVQAYADKMGVPISTPNSQAEEQMPDESQEMGEEMPMARMGGMIKRADGSYSKRGLWDNIRANKGSGKKPTKAMLEQEKKIKAKYPDGGAFPPGGIPKSAAIPKVYYSASEIALDPLKRQNAINNMGIRNLAVNNIGSTMPYDFGTPQYVMTDQESPLILRKMRDALKAQQYANGGDVDGDPPYITKLNPQEEIQFKNWYEKLSKYKGLSNNPDNQYYDMRGYWKENPNERESWFNKSQDVHFTDKYKQPGHPTFSNESIYSNEKTPGGTWTHVEKGNKWYYHPSKYTSTPEYKRKTIQYLRENYNNEEPTFPIYGKDTINVAPLMLKEKAMGGYMYAEGGSFDNPGFKALPEAVQQKIMANYEMGGMLEDTEMDYTPMEGEEYMEYKKGGIYIKPENRGKFSAAAKRAGMGTQAYAKHILANKENYSSTLVKRANFARNAAKWHHEMGGLQQFATAGMYGDPPVRPEHPFKDKESFNIKNEESKPSFLTNNTLFNFGPKIETNDNNWFKRNTTYTGTKGAKGPGSDFDWQNAAGIAGVGLLSNAGNIYNIARGLKKPEDWQYERATAQYLDPSADLAENARMYQEAKRASQYASAGNATNYLANTAAGRAAKMNADRLVRTNYGNANAQIANQLGLFNTQIANAEMNAKQQDEAQRRNLIGQGMSGIGENVLGFTGDLMRMNAYNNYFDNPDFKKTTKGLPTLGGTRSSTTGSNIGKTGR